MARVTPSSPRRRAIALAATLLLPALAVAGCDRQNPAQPQGGEPAAVDNAATPSAQRYRVDRSNAGQPIAPATLTGSDGAPVTLASLAGRPVVLNLWATWCAPCVEELPTLDALAASAGGRFAVVALSQDLGDASVPRAFLTDRNFTHLSGWHDADNTLGLAYGQALPTTILIGADGKEVLRVIGPLDWNGAAARALLAEAGIDAVT